MKQEIKNKVPEITEEGIEEVLKQDPETIKKYLDNWHKFTPDNPGGFFREAVKNKYQIPHLGNKPPNMTGYEKHNWSDDFLESFYEN